MQIETLYFSSDTKTKKLIKALLKTAKSLHVEGAVLFVPPTRNEKKIAEKLGEDRMRIVKALNYLEEKGLIKISVSGVRQIYRLKNQGSRRKQRGMNRDLIIAMRCKHQGIKPTCGNN